MIEIERMFLAKYLPNLNECEKVEMMDVYMPAEIGKHSPIRIRRKGDKFRITKKYRVSATELKEETIELNEREFNLLIDNNWERVSKIRYKYPYNGLIAEIDVFQDKLTGLVTVDFEFDDNEKAKNFEMPDFCLTEVTNEDFMRGGVIFNKGYEDIKDKLEGFGYKKLFLENVN
ncbi:MAG: hypothetical protein KAQ83_03510 [Nanoarchaeota archaeon]|nr:hypothetical protein [Nanoarchaeota archaeon]